MNKLQRTSSGFTVVEAFFILVVIGVLGLVGWLFYASRHKVVETLAGSNSTKSVTSGTAINGVPVRYVNLPAALRQQTMSDRSVRMAQGHYLGEDISAANRSSTNNEGGRLIYDGKTVYDGPYLFDYSISRNGLHYMYVLDTDPNHKTGDFKAYVDEKLVATVPDSTNDLTYMAVSNDGKSYAYVSGNTGTQLIKNGAAIFTEATGIGPVSFSSDLSHYIAPTKFTNGSYDAVVDGKAIASRLKFTGTALPSVDVSENGSHYIYTDGTTLYRDGKVAGHAKGVEMMAVTGVGSYGYADPLSNQVTINGSTHAISSQFATGCNPSCPYTFSFAMDNTGSHYIFGAQELSSWSLDGNSVKLQGMVANTEFVGGTLYVYRWPQ